MYLYHYFDAACGPFRNLSDLSEEKAQEVLRQIRQTRPGGFCAGRAPEYMVYRKAYEEVLRREFRKKGGIIKRRVPHYLTLGHSPWLSSWFTNSCFIKIPVAELDLRTVSFTYGDSHPTFSPFPRADDWKEYRGQLYTYPEILKLIDKYGMPQDWNNDGTYGPERYIEAHVWNDMPIKRYQALFSHTTLWQNPAAWTGLNFYEKDGASP